MIINAVVIEDVPNNIAILKSALESVCPHVRVIGVADSVAVGYQLIKGKRPDLVFLDIQIKGGTSFDILGKLLAEDELGFEMIFLTAYGNYENSTKALRYSALDFLEKPIEEKQLKAVIGRLERKMDKELKNLQVASVLDRVLKGKASSRRIAIHLIKGIIQLVEIDNIIYLEADGSVTKVHLKDGAALTAVKNLGFYDRLLVEDYAFFRISDKIVVNLEYVHLYNHAELTLKLKDQTVLYASRRGGKSLKDYFNSGGSNYKQLQEKETSLLAFLRRLFRE